MNKRTKSRDYAIQLMYSADITDTKPCDIIEEFWANNGEADEEVREFATNIVTSTYERKDSDDDLISKFLSKSWSLERIGTIEKNILRLGIYELFEGDAPVYAIMKDYVTLAKKYGDDKSASFINGLLESVRVKFNIERGNDKPANANKN